MYSGLLITNYSGNLIGTHQKFDKLARKNLRNYLVNDKTFPSKQLILRFEGKNGPDGMKTKTKFIVNEEPMYFIDPSHPDNGELLNIITRHYTNLIQGLKLGNQVRSAFEAAWLAHAIVDGLTPAHQFPYEEKLNELHGNKKIVRDTIYKKIIVPSNQTSGAIANNWQMWGPKGLFTTHALFESGAAMAVIPLTSKITVPNQYEIKTIRHLGLVEYYKRVVSEVATLKIYDTFYKRGWTPKLARIVRRQLAPIMAKTVTLAWLMAAQEAGLTKGELTKHHD